MMTWGNISFQDANSPLMEQLIFFHDHTLMILSMITIMVLYIMINILTNKMINRYLLEGQTIELLWTLLPAVTLIFIALPSLRLLYMMDEMNSPMVTIKVIGHQWFWSYEYSDFNNVEFDSYMKPKLEMTINDFRLLDVDNNTVVPMNSNIRLIVTAADVIHSWTIPALGVKIDAVPGRLNQVMINLSRPGIMYGQCSEICGVNHSFMPITIESTNMKSFINWINSM
uniref:cytochrome c oxidase subunit II n=1 Tax=Tessaromerus quadriarticulatus TaxID=3020145 RepID=UPI0024110CF6|nr:cytochrome c oxidase subunit II [Tessaromerus quadriarticulatus]WEM32416.1 cytochrome c oxidase subunit II [Tessaromerus quadriarticulatus]